MIRLGISKPRQPVAAKGFTIESDGFIPQGLFGGGSLPRTFYNYGRDVGQGYDSNVIMAPIFWIMRTFTEAHAEVESKTNGIWRHVDEDAPPAALERLIDKPNDFYGGDALWKATCISYSLQGEGFWRKERNRFGDVLHLWYTPHWLIEPKWPQDGSQFITHYDYRPTGGPAIPLAPRDVIHFRFGLDPRDTRRGFAPLKPLLREVFTDDEAAAFSAKILENMGVPGLVVSPKDASFRPTDQDVEKMKTGFTGDNRGSTVVTKGPTDVKQFGFDPQALNVSGLRDVSEERVCACLGLPSAVVGFGSGQQSTGVGATMRELRRLAWVQCLTPMQKSLARQLTEQLLPDFVSQTRRFRVRFDTSDVSIFQEEAELMANRVATLVQAGLLRVDRGQEMLGLEVDEARKIYLQPSNSMPIDEFGDPIREATPPGAVPGQESLPATIADRMPARNGGNGRKPEEDG
jgi:HK97 family phage portal protein